MEKKLQLAEEDMQKLSRMSKTLFGSWQDKMADHFEKGCLNEMERQWKQYLEMVNPIIRQLAQIEKDMEECRESCKKR